MPYWAVLGDIGRAPRMTYHTLSLASKGYHVDFIGMKGSKPTSAILGHPLVTIHELEIPFSKPIKSKLLYPILAFLKVCFMFMMLTSRMVFGTEAGISHILVQTPPAIPTLPAAACAAVIKRAKLVIDWHNLGYTLMEKGGRPGIMTRLYQGMEKNFSSIGDAHLCVSENMSQWLKENFDIEASVHHDVPFRYEGEVSGSEDQETMLLKHKFLSSLRFACPAAVQGGRVELNLFTKAIAVDPRTGRPLPRPVAQWQQDRPLLVVAPCSYTPDEELVQFLEAAVRLDEHLVSLYGGGKDTEGETETETEGESDPVADTDVAVRKGKSKPAPRAPTPAPSPSVTPNAFQSVVFVFTGRGPLKAPFKAECKHLNKHVLSKRVRIHTAFLKADDYPRLLMCADLGLCLHSSSSQLDLPMKALDMFGAGIPTVAARYNTLYELVCEDKERPTPRGCSVNGITFDNGEELLDAFTQCVGTPDVVETETEDEAEAEAGPTPLSGRALLSSMSTNIHAFYSDEANQWSDRWTANVQPLFETEGAEEVEGEGERERQEEEEEEVIE
ncbi:chitobiosyldiphosphodolichol beta-mannosyltransferase ALG1-like [Kipferlia bialata]|uniref:Chitobiosyldiphosphodolichol beta-mannosyltransferase ALG1-like n=1 Tax=Kipferlia bialata TaxID=797122 RepID=A0A9K3CZ22_9EUKA|nr:chitobiosyldiphosphodolichol beta-mannosyltransferase ALG1-like [Kipferlia bialata]|eukprot:g7748.t1